MKTPVPLRYKPFRFLLAGRTVNALGNAIAPVALAFAVLDLTGSASDLGLVVGVRMLTNVVFLLFGGALADRIPKNLLMVGSSIAAALTQAAVAVSLLSGTATVPLLLALSAVNGMVAALALPASSAILPQLVPADARQQANGLNRLFYSGAYVIGAPVGGVIVASTNPGWGIAVDAAMFVVSAVMFALLRMPATVVSAEPSNAAGPSNAAAPSNAAGPEKSGIVADLITGWTAFRSRTWLWVVVAAFALINACSSGQMNVLGPLVADETIGRKAWGFVLAAQTVGMMLGAVVAMRIRVTRLLLLGVIWAAFMALPPLVLGVAPHLGLLMTATFVAGFAVEQFSVAWETSMQEHVPGEMLARVYSYDMVGSFVAIPIGQVASGPIAEAVGTGPTLVGAAGLMTVAVLAMLSSRDVRTLRHLSTGPQTDDKAPSAPVEQSLP